MSFAVDQGLTALAALAAMAVERDADAMADEVDPEQGAFGQPLRDLRRDVAEGLSAGDVPSPNSKFVGAAANQTMEQIHRGADEVDQVDPELVAFGLRLRALRRKARLTQRELGFATGIHRVTINRLEHGKIEIGLRNLQRLSTALSVSTSKLAD